MVGSASDKSYIGAEKAKEIAFAHAGVAASDVGFSKAELDFDDGRIGYEVDFSSGTVEYEYEVDALSGAVLKSRIRRAAGMLHPFRQAKRISVQIRQNRLRYPTRE